MGCLNMMTIVVLAMYFVTQCMAWNDLQTTFRGWYNSDKPPRTLENAKDQGWTKISDCCSTPEFAGIRMLEPTGEKAVPDKIMIYNQQGEVAGMQSLVPADDFVDVDCTDNEYYVTQMITVGDTSVKFCMATIYFAKPDTICRWHSTDKGDLLYLQKGTNPANYRTLLRTYDEVDNNKDWHKDKYFPAMGHHATSNVNRDDCSAGAPLQALYAWFEGECRLTGFAWTHLDTKTPEGCCWEKPNSWIVRMIGNDVPQCVLDASGNGLLTTQHVWLTNSTTHCTWHLRDLK